MAAWKLRPVLNNLWWRCTNSLRYLLRFQQCDCVRLALSITKASDFTELQQSNLPSSLHLGAFRLVPLQHYVRWWCLNSNIALHRQQRKYSSGHILLQRCSSVNCADMQHSGMSKLSVVHFALRCLFVSDSCHPLSHNFAHRLSHLRIGCSKSSCFVLQCRELHNAKLPNSLCITLSAACSCHSNRLQHAVLSPSSFIQLVGWRLLIMQRHLWRWCKDSICYLRQQCHRASCTIGKLHDHHASDSGELSVFPVDFCNSSLLLQAIARLAHPSFGPPPLGQPVPNRAVPVSELEPSVASPLPTSLHSSANVRHQPPSLKTRATLKLVRRTMP